MVYQSQMTFLYFDDFEKGKFFLEHVLQLKAVYTPEWAVVYQGAGSAYIGAVDAKRGSVESRVRGGFLVSLTVDDVMPHYERLHINPEIKELTSIKIFEDIGVKSFFFKGPEGYDFEIQQFTSKAHDFTQVHDEQQKWHAEILQAEKAFNEASTLNGAPGWASYFLEEGKMLSKSGRPFTGPKEIQQAIEPLFALHQLQFTWEPSYVEVSKDGSLGYTYGSYLRQYELQAGAKHEEKGMYMSIWKRDVDGKWRVAADVGN